MSGCGHEAHTWIWGKRHGAGRDPAGDWRYRECRGDEDAPTPLSSVAQEARDGAPGGTARRDAQGGSEGVGICGATADGAGQPVGPCSLPAGHAGWHREGMTNWTEGRSRQQEFIGPAHPNYQGPKVVHTAYDYAVVEILRVVDGDTVDARVETDWEDKGFHVEVKTRTAHRFRLIGVDTPERGQPGWAEATEFTRTWLVGPLRVRTHKSDSFGRWMGEFYDPGSGRTLGAALLEAGHARVWPA